MYGSGAKTIMEPILRLLRQIRQDLIQALIAYFVVVAGENLRRIFEFLIGRIYHQIFAISTSACAWSSE